MIFLKTKYIILLLFALLFTYNQAIASDLKVEANIKSWIYESALEINLNSNDKDAKIFYYTDWEWRLDNQKEYKKDNPIIIKESSSLNFHAIKWYEKATLIKEEKYEINYSNEFKVKIEKNKIIIKNTSDKIQNIWYWKIKWNNINKEIEAYTYIEVKKSIFLDYSPINNEEISFISPDNKVIIKSIYTEPVLDIKLENIDFSYRKWTKKILENLENKDTEKELISLWEKVNNNIESINKNNTFSKDLNNKNIKDLDLNSLKDKEYINNSNNNFNINNNLKTSSIDSEKNDNLIIFLAILGVFLIIISQIVLNLEDLKSFIKNKIK